MGMCEKEWVCVRKGFMCEKEWVCVRKSGYV